VKGVFVRSSAVSFTPIVKEPALIVAVCLGFLRLVASRSPVRGHSSVPQMGPAWQMALVKRILTAPRGLHVALRMEAVLSV